MSLQLGLLLEALATLPALVRSVSRVVQHVKLQLLPVEEIFTTKLALELLV